MAKILTFRNRENGSSGQTYLTDDTEKLSFHTAEDGAVSIDDMSPPALTGLFPDPRKDWTNQELADLFRVRRLLSGANVPVDTQRGITDEGDPWFVFCHPNGDVFIHMARIDGVYVLDSPNVRRPLRGADFNGLIADFTNDALPATDGDDRPDGTERRVIRLERGGKVRLHPSAMLAALIWTLFLASEELVLLTPEETTAGDDDLLNFSGIITADMEFAAMDSMDTADIAGLAIPQALNEIQDDDLHGAPETQVQMRESGSGPGLAMHQNAFTMGLSTIAIAMGFMSEAVLLDNQRKALEGLKAIGFTQYAADAEASSELDRITGDDVALLDMLAEFLGLDLSLNTDMADAPEPQNTLPQQDMLHVTAAVAGADAVATPDKTVQNILREDGDHIDFTAAPSEMSQTDAPAEEDLLIAARTAAQEPQDGAHLSVLDALNKTHQMEEFQLGQTTVMASFDVTQTSALSLSDYIFFKQRSTNHREFDDQARSFIDFVQAKETDVGVITIGNEIIMIDRGAFDNSGAETYTFSWETYDGQVISMIGLRSEFEQFDLIA